MVLLPGWVIWKQVWISHANLSLGRLASDRIVNNHLGEWLVGYNDGYKSLVTVMRTFISMLILVRS
jgi:hypothetical protein